MEGCFSRRQQVATTTKLPESPLHAVEQLLTQLGAQSICHEKSLNEVLSVHLKSGGSRVRAQLTLDMGEQLGLPERVCVPLAAAIEGLHQASLIHDDLLDEDRSRRGVPSVWYQEGSATAVCLGDALISQAYELLTQIEGITHAQLVALIRAFNEGVTAMAAGQSLDCQWSTGLTLSYADYEQAVRHKSGPLLGLPIALPLALARGYDARTRTVLNVAMDIGIAYQLADDFDDREDDQGVHLNGFWILVEETGSIEAAERALRVLFDGYIDDAMAALDLLPRPCQAIVQGLIGRLYQKYPSLQKVA